MVSRIFRSTTPPRACDTPLKTTNKVGYIWKPAMGKHGQAGKLLSAVLCATLTACTASQVGPSPKPVRRKTEAAIRAGDAALRRLARAAPERVVVDPALRAVGGIKLLREIRQHLGGGGRNHTSADEPPYAEGRRARKPFHKRGKGDIGVGPRMPVR